MTPQPRTYAAAPATEQFPAPAAPAGPPADTWPPMTAVPPSAPPLSAPPVAAPPFSAPPNPSGALPAPPAGEPVLPPPAPFPAPPAAFHTPPNGFTTPPTSTPFSTPPNGFTAPPTSAPFSTPPFSAPPAPHSAPPAALVPRPGPYPPAPMSAVPVTVPPHPVGQSVVAVQIGEIMVTPPVIRTPAGVLPLAGASWHVADHWQKEEKIATWALVCAVLGFFCLTFFSLLFLLVKETRHHGTVQVTVTNGAHQYVARIPVVDQSQVQHLNNQVNYARTLSLG
ncbi:hypothetical protein ACFO0M_11630 [Micromonospora mangrovi]|uniref:Uncharacterized protein n=2 Tax=Micromonospora TaxID=1873 RepID=A0AAU8HDP5_9ACTN